MKSGKFIQHYREYLNENYSNIHNNKKYYEKLFNIEIAKVLGDESIGVAYLTKSGDVLKITPSKSEFDISNKLIKYPNDNFPNVFQTEILNNKWYGIHKEFVPFINFEYRKKYLLVEKELNEWFDDKDNEELLMHKLILTKDTLFYNYLLNEQPYLVNVYKQLMDMVNYTKGIVNNDAVDIHIDNLGIKDNKIILFDY